MDEIQAKERPRHISASFALLTAKLENATGLAATGQGPRTNAELRGLARQFADLSGEVATVAHAFAALLPAD